MLSQDVDCIYRTNNRFTAFRYNGLLSLLYVNKYPYKVKKLILLDITTPTPIGINYLNKLYLREKDNDKISYYMNIIKNIKDIKMLKI